MSCYSAFASINVFILPSPASTGLPERDTSLTSKLPERNFANQFGTGEDKTYSLYASNIFFLPEHHFYLLNSKKVKLAKNAAFDFSYLIGRQTKPIAHNQTNVLISLTISNIC